MKDQGLKWKCLATRTSQEPQSRYEEHALWILMRWKCVLLGESEKATMLNWFYRSPHYASTFHQLCTLKTGLSWTWSPMLSCLPMNFRVDFGNERLQQIRREAMQRQVRCLFFNSSPVQLQFDSNHILLWKASTPVLNSQVNLGHWLHGFNYFGRQGMIDCHLDQSQTAAWLLFP